MLEYSTSSTMEFMGDTISQKESYVVVSLVFILLEVIEVILSPSDRYMQTKRKAPSRKPVDIWGEL